jgi:hypothetical protein
MKTLTYTTALFMAMAATSVFAHHPAEGMVPEATYETINENLLEATSPHLDMDLDMAVIGYTNAAGDAAMDQATSEQAGWTSDQNQAGDMTMDQPTEGPGPDAAAAAADTMNLLEEVAP